MYTVNIFYDYQKLIIPTCIYTCILFTANAQASTIHTISIILPYVYTGSGLGDPHIVSLDQRQYTFNGLGEYTVFRINGATEREFEIQGRTSLVTNSTATQFSSIAFGVPQDTYVEVSGIG